MEIGKRLRMLRLRQGLSQKELADKIDYAQCVLSLVENGKRPATMQLLVKMAEALNMPIADLLAEELPEEVGVIARIERRLERIEGLLHQLLRERGGSELPESEVRAE